MGFFDDEDELEPLEEAEEGVETGELDIDVSGHVVERSRRRRINDEEESDRSEDYGYA